MTKGKIKAVLFATVSCAALLTAFNMHQVPIGSYAEVLNSRGNVVRTIAEPRPMATVEIPAKDGSSVSEALTEAGIHFTRPFSGQEFVVWTPETKRISHKEINRDGARIDYKVSARIDIPDTFEPQEHVRVNYQFNTAAMLGFHDEIFRTNDEDIKTDEGLKAFALRGCREAAKQMFPIQEGRSVKNFMDIQCEVTTADKRTASAVVRPIRKFGSIGLPRKPES